MIWFAQKYKVTFGEIVAGKREPKKEKEREKSNVTVHRRIAVVSGRLPPATGTYPG
jgi:hypothetical protein